MTQKDIGRLTAPLEKQCTRDAKILAVALMILATLGAIALVISACSSYGYTIGEMIVPALIICALGAIGAAAGAMFVFQKLSRARALLTGEPHPVTLRSRRANPNGSFRLDIRWTEPRLLRKGHYGALIDVERLDSYEAQFEVLTRASDAYSVAVVLNDKLYIAPRRYWP